MRYRTHFTKLDEFMSTLPVVKTNSLLEMNPHNEKAPCDPSILKYKIQKSDPGPVSDDCLETFIKAVKQEILKSKVKPPKGDNLPPCLRDAIKSLKSNQKIVIKKADKGSAVVVMDITDYIHECTEQLKSTKTYKPLAADPCAQISSEVKAELDDLLETKILHKRAWEYLQVPDPKPGRFYVLPKIHKKGVPGRPICSSNGHPTEHISEFVDDYIKKYVTMNESYVRDTQDFIDKVTSLPNLPKDSLLCTLDVTSLYSNIPTEEGIAAVSERLYNDSDLQVPARPLLTLLRLVLENNVITFNSLLFVQILGTAMGTKLAPSYANIFLGKLEKELLAGYHLKPEVWIRYIDDIFCVWTHGREEFDKFVDYLNSKHDTIKFTTECATDKINFLDTWVHIKDDGSLYTSLFTKPTDTHDYLHYSSSHPGHMKKGGPRSQLLRIRRICTLDEDFKISGQNLIKHYTRRGYPNTLIQQAFNEIVQLSQKDLLKVKPKSESEEHRLFFITDYNPRNPDIRQFIENNWHLLHLNDIGRKVFPNPPTCGHRRTENLRDILVTAALKSSITSPTTRFTPLKCNKQNCTWCTAIHQRKGWIRSSVTRRTYRISANTTCMTNNVIYLLSCKICKKQYVGETKRSFIVRYKEHRRDIVKKKDSPVAIHFAQKGHTADDIIPTILDFMGTDPAHPKATASRKERERFWMSRLRSLTPFGINVQS